MHTGTLKKLALALTFWLALHMSSLRAQLLGPYGTSPITFEVDANGLLSDTGTFGTGTLSLSGAGTRMFWYPGKAAFRAGYVNSTQWNDANIGRYSTAFGGDTTASGNYSTAMGFFSTASGSLSTAMGRSTANGSDSTAMGFFSTANGSGSTAMGDSSTANGDYSTAMGGGTATGNYSIAMGFVIASGDCSTAFGSNTTASGYASTASGFYTMASAQLSFAIGAYNVGGGNATSWVATDPIFEIGNGHAGTASNSYTPTLSDAFVVYKNGNTTVQGNLTTGGIITAAPGGDIPMYTGN